MSTLGILHPTGKKTSTKFISFCTALIVFALTAAAVGGAVYVCAHAWRAVTG